MPARQRLIYKGFKITASPDFWLRRWTRFPFFFESHNPSFRVNFVKIEDNIESFSVKFNIFFADNTTTSSKLYLIPTESMRKGASHKIILREIFTSFPGQTIIRMPLSDSSKEWYTLYAYKVRTEEQLWLWIATPIVALIGALLQRYIGFLG